MIVLSVGMPRAGSGWYYNLTNDLMIAAGFDDGRSIRRQFHLEKILTEVNCNIGALTLRRLVMVLIPSMLGKTFVIKAHSRPTPAALTLIRYGWMQAAYIFRDPRDAMLSAYENGSRAKEKGQPNAFSQLVDFETSLAFIHEYTQIGESWLDCDLVFATRYEGLLADFDGESQKLASFLKIDVSKPAIQEVLDQNRPDQAAQGEKRGMHFSKGKTGRFREKYTREQQAVMNERLGSFLTRLGYPL
jgi:hypothetical protein